MFFIYFIAIPSVILMSGCQNTLIFAERSSFKIGIHVNDNAVTPVEINAGFKRTVVALVPPSDDPDKTEAGDRPHGEATNLVSGFALSYTTTPGDWFNEKLTIKSQFASGGAALIVTDDTAKKILNVRIVSPVPEALQKRREAAAEFVKTSLTPAQLDTLANNLGRAPGANALINILDSISAAESQDAFTIIAQKLKLLFGKDV